MAPSRRRGSSKALSAAAAAAAKRNWKVGDLVLAKVKGFPAWPATVSEPEKWGYSTDWKKVLVYFFGTKQIAFCNPADVEAFTEEKKKSLLSKRHGKGADFVRAVQEIVDCYEKSKEQERDDEVKSGDEGNISNAGNMEDSTANMDSQSPMAIPNSRLESLCVSADNNGLHHLVDVKTELANGGLRDMDTVSEEQFENASSLDHLREAMVASDSLRKRLIDAPIQSFVIQKRTAARRSRSTIKVEPCKLQSQVMTENDISTNTGVVLPNGTRNEFAKRSIRNRKSPGTSVWHHIESPGYSTAFASNVSSEDNGSETGATNSDTISVNGGNTLEFSCKSEQPATVVEVLDRGFQLSDRFNLPAESFVFKKKRKPTRKRLSHSTAAVSVSPDKSPGSGIGVDNSISAPSNACENLPDQFSRADGDEHLPLVKRARVRMGKPPSEEKRHNEFLDTELESSKKVSSNNSEPTLAPFSCGNTFRDPHGSEEKRHNELLDTELESSKKVSSNNSEPTLASFSCGNNFRDLHGSSFTNGYSHAEKEPFWNAKYQLRGSVDGEAALPPSEEKQHNELLDTELESSKKVSSNNSEPTLAPFSCGNNFRDLHGSSFTNGYSHADREPIWNAKYQLRGSVDGEAALPPSKRLHRALEAMSANAAEEGQTFIDAQETTKVTSSNGCSDSSDKSSSHISVDNEAGSASEVQNASSFADNDANINGEYELMHGLTSPTSEISAKASSEPRSFEHYVECSIPSESDDYKEIKIVKNSVEIKYSVDSPLNIHSSETVADIKRQHPSSNFKHEQGVLESKILPMGILLPSPNRERVMILGSSLNTSSGNLMLEHAYFQEDKLAQEQSTSEPNHRGQDLSEVNEAEFYSSGGDDTHLSVVNMDSCGNVQSLVSPLDKSVPAMCEVVKDVEHKPAEKGGDPNSMKVLIAAAQAKRQLSLSTSLSDNMLDDKVVYDTVSSPSSIRRVGSCEQLSPPSSTVCHLSTADNRNHHLHNGSLEVLPSKKSSRFLELEDVGSLADFSHRSKSLGQWPKADANAVRKSFESMLGTLSRTKESIGRATRLAIDCAKFGIADEVLEILVRNLEIESSLHKRVDLFFLVDSITQCSRGQKGDIGGVYPSAVQAMLPRLLSAAAPPGNTARENRRQCLKVLRLWLERKTLPESIVRHHMRELESADASFPTVHSRRPSRMERALDDPIREMEGMHVDEYGSNASFQIPGFCMPRMLEEEGSDTEEGSFEAVTPEQDPEIPVEREAPPTSVYEKRCHILEDVDGELEMEDVAPSFEAEKSCANDFTAVDNMVVSHHQFEQHLPLLFAPPLPEYCPPSPPPLPASPPPAAPPPPPLATCYPFTDLKFQSNHHNMQNSCQHRMSRHHLEAASLNPVTSDTVHYCAPGYEDLGKQSLRPGSVSSSASRGTAPPLHACNRQQQIDEGSLHNKSYHLQPPPPILSNQFSYAHEDPRRRSWMEASSSFSCTKRLQYGSDIHREEAYEYRRRMDLARHEVGERCRIAIPVHVESEAAYTPTSRYGLPQESSRILNKGWSFPPRTLGYHNATPYRPPEAPNLWRRR